MVVDIQEAYNLMDFWRIETGNWSECSRQWLKIQRIIPEGESSVDFLKKVRESQYD